MSETNTTQTPLYTEELLQEGTDRLHEAYGYAVALCVLNDPMLGADTVVYGVYNTTTGVREAEARRLTNAEQLCGVLSGNDGRQTGIPQQQDLTLN